MQYNISKGDFHPSGIHFGIHFGRVNQTYKVRFDSSCLYDDTIDWERDWNKLTGWSYSNLPYHYETEDKWQAPHHRNSVRFAWRSNRIKGVIEITFYYYMDGVRYIEEFCEVPVNRECLLSIILKQDRAVLVAVCKETNLVEFKSVILPHAFKAIASYKLYPYFGGTNPAYNDMILEVTEM